MQVDLVPGSRPRSVEFIRRKLDGHALTADEMRQIIQDISVGNLTDIELTAWATATYVHDMTIEEIVSCVEAMVDSGETVSFDRGPVLDVHSIGGVPGNKYAPIAVSIVAANDLLIPKTSSRAISSACGTADFMEVVAPVEFSAADIKRIAEQTGGILAWGGGVNLAPADDEIIRVEYPLSIDPRAQLIASVLAKKKAVGAQHVVIDIPIGAGAKIFDAETARKLARDFIDVGERLGMAVQCTISYGGQPIGRAIGPILEIREALEVLEGADHPMSLIEKACSLSGVLLELGGAAQKGEGYALAIKTLSSGAAHKKFLQIIQAQGAKSGLRADQLTPGDHKAEIRSDKHGYVEHLDNKKLIKIARAAGAPRDKGAGIWLHQKKGRRIEVGEPLYTIYAEHAHRLKDAVSLANHLKPFMLEGMVLEEIVE
jgi:AMP phosphorylase